MKKEKMLELLEQWKSNYISLSEVNDKVYDIFEATLPDACWETFDLYTDTLSELLGDTMNDTWLSWFCFENDMGAKGYEAGYDDNLKPIKSLEDLADLIIQHKERK